MNEDADLFNFCSYGKKISLSEFARAEHRHRPRINPTNKNFATPTVTPPPAFSAKRNNILQGSLPSICSRKATVRNAIPLRNPNNASTLSEEKEADLSLSPWEDNSDKLY